MPRFLLTAVAAALGLVAASAQPDETPVVSDADVLKSVGLDAADGTALVGYLKLRTVSETDRGRLEELIHRFAADKFDDRLAAAAAVERLGPLAISPLRKVADDKTTDPEIAYRAGLVLKRIQTVDHAKVSAAAVRGVVKLKPPGAAGALLGFLPLADGDGVADDIRAALVALAVQNGRADPALVAGLADESAVRRAACYVALVEGGPAAQRVRVPDAFPKVKEAVRRDPDVEAKFRGLWVLAHTTREKEFVPDLIATAPALPRGRLWQLEDFLLRLAGEHPPGCRFGRTPEAVAKARDAWAAWWPRGGVDLGKADLTPRVQGLTDLVLHDPAFGRMAVAGLGPDLKEVWRLGSGAQPAQPYDARVLPGGLVLLAEQNNGRVTERDRAGSILRAHNTLQPVGAEVLPNGNWLVIGRSMVSEVRPAAPVSTVVRSYTRPATPQAPNVFDIVTGKRLPNGETVFVTTAAQGPNCFRLNEKLELVGQPLAIGRITTGAMTGVDVTPDGKLLVTLQNQVVEYDLRDGKAGWTYDIPFATSVQRLANGNTLIGAVNAGRAYEVTPEREVVWEYASPDGMGIARVYRR